MANGNGRGQSTDEAQEIVVGFGRQANVAVGDLEDSDLDWYIKAYTENIADPDKKRFKSKNQVVLDALNAERDRRAGIEPGERPTSGVGDAGSTALELVKTKVLQLFPRRGSDDRPVRVLDLPEDLQREIVRVFALPPDVNLAMVQILGGRAYPDSDCLLDLASRRKLTKLETTPLPPEKCVDLGCSTKVYNGWKAEGTHYGSKRDAVTALRAKYPEATDGVIEKKIYTDFVYHPAEDWQRSHSCRAEATFIGIDGVPVTYSFVADACPHNTTSTVASALRRMCQRRATNIALRGGVKLPGASLEELDRIKTDEHGRVVAREVDEDKEVIDAEPTVSVKIVATEGDKEEIERLAALLKWNRGKLDQLIGQKQGKAEDVIAHLKDEVAKLSRGPQGASAAAPAASPASGPANGKAAPAAGGWTV